MGEVGRTWYEKKWKTAENTSDEGNMLQFNWLFLTLERENEAMLSIIDGRQRHLSEGLGMSEASKVEQRQKNEAGFGKYNDHLELSDFRDVFTNSSCGRSRDCTCNRGMRTSELTLYKLHYLWRIGVYVRRVITGVRRISPGHYARRERHRVVTHEESVTPASCNVTGHVVTIQCPCYPVHLSQEHNHYRKKKQSGRIRKTI